MTLVSNLLDNKAKLESEIIHYKFLLANKDNQLLAVTTKLENTKKSLKMMNSGIQKLDHILSIGKSSLDHHGLEYQDSKDSNSKSAFVKASQLTATLEDQVFDKGQSSEPSLKEKELVEEGASKETPENVKEKVSKL